MLSDGPSKTDDLERTMASDASKRIDQHIKSLGDWRGEMLGRLRAVVKKADPEIVEEWKW